MLAITCGGFGAHSWWEKNQRRCEKINAKQWCEHCHKEMTIGTGWVVNWNWKDDSLYPIDGDKFEYRLLGNECIKQFLKKDEYSSYARRVDQS